MLILENLDQIKEPLKNPVVTIGNFDGVHRGHMTLFEMVKEKALAIKGVSVVMTFEPHPVKVMKPEKAPFLITPTRQKIKLIGRAGIDITLCIPFTKEFAKISAREFVHGILVEKIGVREVVVGYDYTFGTDRQGDIELLKKMGKELEFKVHVVEPIKINGTLVSSSSIRKFVRQGNLSEAKRLLGRNYQISGTVVRGKGRGGTVLGFPTANIQPLDELTPKPGVYATLVYIDDSRYHGLTNIGYNPTFGDQGLSVETHILDYSDELLGKNIIVEFLRRLRDEKSFSSPEELVLQIKDDVLMARKLFKSGNLF